MKAVDYFGLITFWAFVIAIYEAFPVKIRSKMEMFVSNSLTLLTFLTTSLIAIVANMELSHFNNGYLLSIPTQGSHLYNVLEYLETFYYPDVILGFGLNTITYLILALYTIVSLWKLRKAKVSRQNIEKVQKHIEALYRRDLYDEQKNDNWILLIDLLDENIQKIFHIAHKETKIRIYLKRLLSKKPLITIDYTLGQGKKENGLQKMQKFITEIPMELVRVFFIRKNAWFLPPDDKNESAKEILQNHVFNKTLLKLSIKYKPGYIPNILSQINSYPGKFETYTRDIMTALLETRGSLLYDETWALEPRGNFEDSLEGTILLKELLKSNILEQGHLVGGAIDFIKHYVSKGTLTTLEPLENGVYPSGETLKNRPISAVIGVFDWITSGLLFYEIHWHGWVMYLKDLFTEILTIVETNTDWEQENEFPDNYFYYLYLILSTIGDWFAFAEDNNLQITEINPERTALPSNESLLEYAVHTLDDIFTVVSKSNLPPEKKNYLADIIWRTYIKLEETGDPVLKAYGTLLLNLLFKEDYRELISEEKMKLLVNSFYKIDHVDLIEMLNSVEPKIQNTIDALIAKHVPSPTRSSIEQYISGNIYHSVGFKDNYLCIKPPMLRYRKLSQTLFI